MEVDGEVITLVAWPGMVGHNWGSEHAERWIWVEGTGFAADEGIFVDLGAIRLRLGPLISPWIASGMIRIDGRRHRLGGLHGIRSSTVDESPTGCDFSLAGRNIVVHGSVRAVAKDIVGWKYTDPAGSDHDVVNCSIADLELSVERANRPSQRLHLAGAGAYEMGMRETDHGIPIQPSDED